MKDLEKYLDYLKYNKNYSDKTILNYELDLKDYFNFLKVECLDYKEVTYSDLMPLFKHFETNKLTNKSIRRHISSIKGFYKYLVNNEKNMKYFKKGVLPILGITLGIFAIIMLQPDFGTGTIIVMSIIGLLFVGGVDFKFFLKIGLVGVAGVVALIAVAPYRLSRILSFLNPWADPLGSGFQIIQSLYAIGPGGLFGYGFLNSRQKHFYLPEPQTDFIFSIISEEFGFLAVLLVTSLFLTIILTGFKIARNSKDLFGKYLAFGIMFQISFQTLLNLMVVVGLIPVTGVTLPFLSYGGSSLLITLCEIGIVLNISRYEK